MLFGQAPDEPPAPAMTSFSLHAIAANFRPLLEVGGEHFRVDVVASESLRRRSPKDDRAVVSAEPLRRHDDPAARVAADGPALEPKELGRLPELVIDAAEGGDPDCQLAD